MPNKSLRLASISLTIFHLTDINTIVIDVEGKNIFSYERNLLLDFLLPIQQNDFSILQERAKKEMNKCHLYTNELGFSYLASAFQLEEKEVFILINGPFLQQIPNLNNLASSIRSIDPQKKKTMLEEFYRGLKIMSNARIQSTANVLFKLSFMKQAPIDVTDHAVAVATESFMDIIIQQPDEKLINLIDLKSELRRTLIKGIEQGDRDNVEEYLSEAKNFNDYFEHMPSEPIRSMKNSLVSLNTTLRDAAERGKVPPFFTHHVSEKFFIKIEQLVSINHLSQLIIDMCREYCNLVIKHNLSEYSLLISRAIHYIKIYYNQPFELSKLAHYCFVHSVHLSRQFKKETGMTITEYLHRERIEEAKQHLKKDNSPISWIAGYVGFEDAGYFARVFKKFEGMSPSQYRDNKISHTNLYC